MTIDHWLHKSMCDKGCVRVHRGMRKHSYLMLEGISNARSQGGNRYLFSDTVTQPGKSRNTSFLKEGNRTWVCDCNYQGSTWEPHSACGQGQVGVTVFLYCCPESLSCSSTLEATLAKETEWIMAWISFPLCQLLGSSDRGGALFILLSSSG